MTCCARPSPPARCPERRRSARWNSSTNWSRSSAVGYLSFSGEMDLAIAIRTGLIHKGNLYVQAAAGVVADSVPESEWQETENKARAVLRAAEQVQDGLDSDF